MAVKLVIAVRTDLGMGRGKLAAQVAHAAVTAALRSLDTADFLDWLTDGQPKVVLRVVDEDELRTIGAAAREAGLAVEVVHDAGRTQVAAGTPTCIAIGPADSARIDAVTGGLNLL